MVPSSAELQQQIADKKRREAERKQQEAEEDAALNARLEEQQKKMRDDLQREKVSTNVASMSEKEGRRKEKAER